MVLSSWHITPTGACLLVFISDSMDVHDDTFVDNRSAAEILAIFHGLCPSCSDRHLSSLFSSSAICLYQ